MDLNTKQGQKKALFYSLAAMVLVGTITVSTMLAQNNPWLMGAINYLFSSKVASTLAVTLSPDNPPMGDIKAGQEDVVLLEAQFQATGTVTVKSFDLLFHFNYQKVDNVYVQQKDRRTGNWKTIKTLDYNDLICNPTGDYCTANIQTKILCSSRNTENLKVTVDLSKDLKPWGDISVDLPRDSIYAVDGTGSVLREANIIARDWDLIGNKQIIQ